MIKRKKFVREESSTSCIYIKYILKRKIDLIHHDQRKIKKIAFRYPKYYPTSHSTYFNYRFSKN